MLAESLDTFYCVARMAASELEGSGPAVMLVFEAGATPTVGLNDNARYGIKAGCSELLCDLKDTRYRTMDDKLQPQELENLKHLMDPTVSCNEAILLHEIKTCMLTKGLANSMLEHDDVGFVVGIQSMLYSGLKSLVSTPLVYDWALNESPKLLELMNMLLVEIAITMACGHLKMRDLIGFDVWLRRLLQDMEAICAQPIPDRSMPPRIRAYYISITIWLNLYLENSDHETVRDAVRQLADLEYTPHQQHDLDVLRR
jgi:hypothetical protein